MKHLLITGGAGFIGINAAYHFHKKGYRILILDNFSRRGGRENIKWLKSEIGPDFDIIEADIRTDQKRLSAAAKNADIVLHLAAQVAVTTSVTNPREDFNINALGTFNVLEASRLSERKPIVIYSSTNKVYGGLGHISIAEKKTRYEFVSLKHGVDEQAHLDFHSPYGCSKGCADQYVRDYYRIYGIPTIVFRQSCIYGPRQFGIEDQGWVAWFLIALTTGKEITIYGNGKQVRDLLYIDDLMSSYEMVIKNISKTQGKIYNIGGGPKNTLSIWEEFKPILEKLFDKNFRPKFAPTRAGDQPIFISDIQKAHRDFSWRPTIGVEEGIERLFAWVQDNKTLFKNIL